MRNLWLILVFLALPLYGQANDTGTDNKPKFFPEQAGDDLPAKEHPAFMRVIKSLQHKAPEGYKLIMEKVREGATVREVKDYILR